LPHILPKLVHLPLSYASPSQISKCISVHFLVTSFTETSSYIFSAFNAHALGALAEVAGPGLNFHLGTVLPALLSAMDGDDKVCRLNDYITFPQQFFLLTL
jgi:hypothetical protein